MVPFGGWEMPLAYPDGTIAEHQACRHDAVVFDVSHLGTLRVTGRDAHEVLQRAFTNDLGKIEPGRCQYTHSLTEDGSVADDIIVWWRAPEIFDVMPNASNTDRIVGALRSLGAGSDVEANDVTSDRVVLAVQGPQAIERLAERIPQAQTVGRFRVDDIELLGESCAIAGTGYTGERGVELAVPNNIAATLWEEIINLGVRPAGLGARDTLRLEAGLPLHGQELGPGITPLNAGLEWVVAWEKGDFVGRAALLAQKEAGVTPVLVGLKTDSKRPPRSAMTVLHDGEPVGAVSSGNYSPVNECGIAMAFVEQPLSVGTKVEIDARGTAVAASVCAMPFI